MSRNGDVTSTHPKGPGDLFASGTTRQQLQQAAQKIVAKGKGISDPSRTVQVFEKKMRKIWYFAFMTLVIPSMKKTNPNLQTTIQLRMISNRLYPILKRRFCYLLRIVAESSDGISFSSVLL